MSKKIPAREYSKAIGQTYQNVVAKLNRGTLDGAKEKGRWFVFVADDWKGGIESPVEPIESTVEPEIDADQEIPANKRTESFSQPFSERSINVELDGVLKALDKEQEITEKEQGLTEKQQNLNSNLQVMLREKDEQAERMTLANIEERRGLNQEISDGKKRGEKTYFKMLAIMLISFVVMAGIIAFIFVWGERAMMRNVDAHRATFEDQKVEFLQMIQKRELEFSDTLEKRESESSKMLAKRESDFSKTIKRADANHAKELKSLERIHEAEKATLEAERSFLLATVLELKKEIVALRETNFEIPFRSGPKDNEVFSGGNATP